MFGRWERVGTKAPGELLLAAARCGQHGSGAKISLQRRALLTGLRRPSPSLSPSPPPAPASHAIVSSTVGPEYYVTIMSFVDKQQLEPGCSVLLHNKVGGRLGVGGRAGGCLWEGVGGGRG